MSTALAVTGAPQALREDRGAVGRRHRGRRGPARRAARPERRREVDARQDRLRPRPPERGRVEVCGAPAGSPPARRALGYLAELFRFPGWMSADELLALHQRLARLVGRRGRARRAARAGRPPRGRHGRASPRCRRACSSGSASRRRWSARRGSCCSTSRRARSIPSGRRVVRELLEELRARGTSVLLNSHLLSEVELVCDHVVIVDHGQVVAAGAADDLDAQGGVEVDTAPGRSASPTPRAPTCRGSCASSSPRARTSSRCASSRRRSRRSIWRWSIDRDRPLRAAREPAAADVRGRGRAHGRLPRALRLRRRLGVQGRASFVGTGRAILDPEALAGATSSGLAMFATCSSARVLAVFLTLNVVRGDAEAGLLQPLVVRPVGRAQLLFARFLGAARCARALRHRSSTSWRSAIADWARSWTPDRIVAPGLELAACRRRSSARSRWPARSSWRRSRTGSAR